jgi:hypothetical protein
MEEIDLARRRDLFGVAEFDRQLAILDLELLPVPELSDVEISPSPSRRPHSDDIAHFTRELKAASARCMTPKIKEVRKEKLQAIALSPRSTDKQMLAHRRRKGGRESAAVLLSDEHCF